MKNNERATAETNKITAPRTAVRGAVPVKRIGRGGHTKRGGEKDEKEVLCERPGWLSDWAACVRGHMSGCMVP